MERQFPGRSPLATIGIPVYNGEDRIQQAIESALAQDYSPLEIVICDNASTDATEELCRRFARADGRIRYLRNPVNIGAVLNFKRVLAEARGTYFTWLAHDDLLSSPRSIRTAVEFLERHPDVVLCASDLEMLDHEAVGMRLPTPLDLIHPDREVRQARLEFFRWPQNHSSLAIYGVYRREQLMRVPISGWTYWNKPIVLNMEFPILTALIAHGRIVALPELLRSWRCRPDSIGARALDDYSGLDKCIIGLRLKWTILANALHLRLPWNEKAELLRVALGNFLVANFRRPLDCRQRNKPLRKAVEELQAAVVYLRGEIEGRREVLRTFDPVDYRRQVGQLEEQAALLRKTADERLQQINRLTTEIRGRRKEIHRLHIVLSLFIIRLLGDLLGAWKVATLRAFGRIAPACRWQNWIAALQEGAKEVRAFFLPAAESEKAEYRRLLDEVGRLQQSQVLARLNAECEWLLGEIDAALDAIVAPSPPSPGRPSPVPGQERLRNERRHDEFRTLQQLCAERERRIALLTAEHHRLLNVLPNRVLNRAGTFLKRMRPLLRKSDAPQDRAA